MDHLSEVAKAARAAGMSYGKYVALAYEQGRAVAPAAKKIEEPEIQELPERFCVICGAKIRHETRGGIKTCGPACSYELNRRRNREYYQKTLKFKPTENRKCQFCGGEFLPNRRNQRFCERKCQEAYKRAVKKGIIKPTTQSAGMASRNYGAGICKICGEEFTKRSARQATCSPECRKVYSGKRKEFEC